MSNKAVCCHCGFSENYIVEELISPIGSRAQRLDFLHIISSGPTTVIPKNWNKVTFVDFDFKLLCPECSDKLNIFLGRTKMKNLAQELLHLSNSKKELNNNKIKAKFKDICEHLKDLAKVGFTETTINVPSIMVGLFEQSGFVIDKQSNCGSSCIINPHLNPYIIRITISWANPTQLE